MVNEWRVKCIYLFVCKVNDWMIMDGKLVQVNLIVQFIHSNEGVERKE